MYVFTWYVYVYVQGVGAADSEWSRILSTKDRYY